MNTNKKVIRLNESDLRNIISESVRQVISELDWKTYASAAEKQLEFGAPKPKGDEYHYLRDPRGERARKFTNAAKDAFQRDYGNPKSYTYGTSNNGQFGYTQMINPKNDRAIEYRSSKDPNTYGVRDTKYHGMDAFDNVGEERPRERMFGDINNEYDDFKAFDKMDDEYKSMQLNKLPKYRENPRTYIKGKGWQ